MNSGSSVGVPVLYLRLIHHSSFIILNQTLTAAALIEPVSQQGRTESPPSKIAAVVLAVLFVVIVLCGCEGPAGAPGTSNLGDDLQAPLVEISLPRSGDQVAGQTVFEAAAWDDYRVVKVEFLLDGEKSAPAGRSLDIEPWQLRWDVGSLALGAHRVQARAWDGMGRFAMSNVVGFQRTHLDSLPQMDTLRFYNFNPREAVEWVLPDVAQKVTGLGVRFTALRPIVSVQAGFYFYWSADWQYRSTRLMTELWSSSNGEPDTLISDSRFDRRSLSPMDIEEWTTVAFRNLPVITGDFFIFIKVPEEPRDTIAILSDNGLWNQNRGWFSETTGVRRSGEGFLQGINPLIYAAVEYE